MKKLTRGAGLAFLLLTTSVHAKQAAVCKPRNSVAVDAAAVLRGMVVARDGTLWVGVTDGSVRQVDAGKGKVLMNDGVVRQKGDRPFEFTDRIIPLP